MSAKLIAATKATITAACASRRAIKRITRYWVFWLADTHDFWYRSNGLTALRTTTPSGQDVRTIGANSFAGHEIDVTLTYELSKNLKLQSGYSHFFAGTYLRDTGAHSDADWAYFMTTINF